MKRWTKGLSRILLASAVALLSAEALGVVGMPATPGSVAGVARRTTRRTAYATSAAVSSSYVTALPGGCRGVMMGGVEYYQCGGAYYRPYYQGTQLVYVIENP